MAKSFFESIKEIEERIDGKKLFCFLDYDGTLTPIVDSPDLAILSQSVRKSIKKLSNKCCVTIISGRSSNDVREKVSLENLFYVGSHGFEITDNVGNIIVNDNVRSMRGTIIKVYSLLQESLQAIQGALVEDIKYTLSVHYRLVADNDFHFLKKKVKEIVEQFPDLRVTNGKKVFEIRPCIDWDKGRAVIWILENQNFNVREDIVVYIGDDKTDEDAFKCMGTQGIGILVSEEEEESFAKYKVCNPLEVKKVLDFLYKQSIKY